MENLNIIKSACFTGYRPEKFNFKLNKNDLSFNTLNSSLSETLANLIENGCTVFYCGMAEGFDILCAECVLNLKKRYKNLRLISAIPYLEHNESIKGEWSKRYNNIISKSDELVFVSTDYHISVFQIRNKYMVDHSDCVVTWYDGKKGGTKNTINYALKHNKPIINLNKDYKQNNNNLQNKIIF